MADVGGTIANRQATRTRLVEVAAGLLREHGPAAVTTRRVAEAAGVQAPTIYRLFGDKDGLLEAVADHVMSAFVAAKAATARAASATDTDPVEDLRAGWQTYLEFGSANPALFRLLTDPGRTVAPAPARSGIEVLAARIHRVAVAGRLRTGEAQAVALVHAAGVGTVTTLLAMPPEQRDPGLADTMFEAVLRQILTDAPAPADDRVQAAAVAFRAVVTEVGVLGPAERALLAEWLDRVVAAGGSGSAPRG